VKNRWNIAFIRHNGEAMAKRKASGVQNEPALPMVRPEPGPSTAGLTAIVGKNLKRLRSERQLSLEKLAQLSQVSRAMLGQIELGQSAPTINVLWKIAHALDVAFSALIAANASSGPQVLREKEAKRLLSADGAFQSRALFPFDQPRRVEFYELKLLPHGEERAEAHPPGTSENLVVAKGKLEMQVGAEVHVLNAGDAIVFEADIAHCYRNPLASDTLLYLVMTYAERIG
jgi:transcriptional regulator with XRE-family HTH domain